MKKSLKEKYDKLTVHLKQLDSVLIALSGGVDSNLLLVIAHTILGRKVQAVTVVSQIRENNEVIAASELTDKLGIKHTIVQVDEMKISNFRNNPVERCYLCKKNLLSKVNEIAEVKQLKYILDGSNFDDLDQYRPGRRAAEEFSVISPFINAGFTKIEIRSLAKECNLMVWDRPSQSCFMTRFPYNTSVYDTSIQHVKDAEKYLVDIGVTQKRVRVYTDYVKIEVLPDDMHRLIENRIGLIEFFHSFNYMKVFIDMDGYISGSMDTSLLKEQNSA